MKVVHSWKQTVPAEAANIFHRYAQTTNRLLYNLWEPYAFTVLSTELPSLCNTWSDRRENTASTFPLFLSYFICLYVYLLSSLGNGLVRDVPVTTNTHAKREELLNACFYAVHIIKGKQKISSSQNFSFLLSEESVAGCCVSEVVTWP